MQSGVRFVRSRSLSVLLVLLMCFSLLPAGAFADAQPDGGDSGGGNTVAYAMSPKLINELLGSGTAEDPYQISSREDFEAIAYAVNGGDDLYGICFKQQNDIDLGGADDPWTVIGYVIGNTPHPFNGVYDGGDHYIYGLFVGTTDEEGEPVGVGNEDAGLFGHVGKDGIIRRTHVVDCKVYNKALYVGGIAGRNEGLVEYCSSDATDPYNSSGVVNGSWQYAGGIVGYNFGTISYCYSNCDVYGAQKVGGITGGQNGGTVVNCYFRGYVYASDITRGYAGGIAGENDGNSTISNCYCDGTVEGKNDNAYCGLIAGSNDTGSTVENCFWEDSEETGLLGVASGMGTVENAEERTSDEFASGQVAWELSKGTNGDGWGQNLNGDSDDKIDKHPHFVGSPDKDYDTTLVYRVTFTANTPPYIYDAKDTKFVDPGEDVELPPLPENTKWYIDSVGGEEFDGRNIQKDMDAVAGMRIIFAGQTGTVTETMIYSTKAQTLDLDTYMKYAEGGPVSDGRFEYTINADNDGLKAVLADDGKTLTIPAETNVKEGGYTLTITAHEKEPYISAFSLVSPSDPGTNDVTLTVNVVIEKATPKITSVPAASLIELGQTLAESDLIGGAAQHPDTGTPVNGTFSWLDSAKSEIPTDSKTSYPVVFTPNDEDNYNIAKTSITANFIKTDVTDLVPPMPVESTYDGTAQALVEPGSAAGGEMKYWLDDGIGSADTATYSSTVPSRANADTYNIWYKVVGDDFHNDTVPQYVTSVIDPIPVNIPAQTFTYTGSSTFSFPVEGVSVDNEESSRTLIVTVTASNKDVGSYTYSNASYGSDTYTVDLSNSNYVINTAGTMTITPLTAVLLWEPPLTFTYDGSQHSVSAVVSNAAEGDMIDLYYSGNTASAAGEYTAVVSGLGNSNYTLTGASNTSQLWYITDGSRSLDVDSLTSNSVTYGDKIAITYTAVSGSGGNVTFYANGGRLGSAEVSGGKATLLTEAASANNFSAGANPITAEYNGSKSAVTVSIAQKPIKALMTGNISKTYDGNNAATGINIAPDGLELCDYGQVTITAQSYMYSDPNAGINKTITANNAVLSGAQSHNYALDDASASVGIIEPKVVGLEWRGTRGLVYRGYPVNVNATAIELIPGDECYVNVTNGANVNAGKYTAMASGLSSRNYALPEDNTKEYTIDPASLYVHDHTVHYNGTTNFIADEYGVTLPDGTSEDEEVRLTSSSPEMGVYTYMGPGTGNKTYTARSESNNYKIIGGGLLTITYPDPNAPSAPSGPGNLPGPGYSPGTGGTGGTDNSALKVRDQRNAEAEQDDGEDDEDCDEDVSAEAAAYADNERLGMSGTLYAGGVIVISAAALTFIMKKKKIR